MSEYIEDNNTVNNNIEDSCVESIFSDHEDISDEEFSNSMFYFTSVVHDELDKYFPLNFINIDKVKFNDFICFGNPDNNLASNNIIINEYSNINNWYNEFKEEVDRIVYFITKNYNFVNSNDIRLFLFNNK